VISEQGSALAYAVTEESETGKSNDLCSSGVLLSESRYDSRTQTEGPSSYSYRLYSTSCQVDTKCTSTRKATDTTSTSTSIESTTTSTTSSSTIIKSEGDES
jgi:hypothetical protein